MNWLIKNMFYFLLNRNKLITIFIIFVITWKYKIWHKFWEMFLCRSVIKLWKDECI